MQLLHEFRTERELLDGSDPVGEELTEQIQILHLEGVYTWDKSIRMTVKQPFVLSAVRQTASGEERTRQTLGDLTLALPLKDYFNLDGKSGSWTLAPQLVVPGGPREKYNVFRRNWGMGLSLGYEAETYETILGVGTTAWTYLGDRAPTIAVNTTVGFNYRALWSSGHIKLKTQTLFDRDDSFTFSIGPTLFYHVTDLLHLQFKWMHDLFDHQGRVDHGNGDLFRTGVGVVF